MAKGKEYVSSCPTNPPDWYWVYGLHDAFITKIESIVFPFDYNKFAKEKSKYNRNCLSLKIEAKSALYDTSIKEIRFYNFKILSDYNLLLDKIDACWKADRLSNQGDCFVLEIDLWDFNSNPKDFTIIIKFDRAEVDRE